MTELITPNGKIAIDCETGQVSDGYHTFDELYEHRCLLFAALTWSIPNVFKTRKDDRGEEIPGWFIAGFESPFGQITYHMPDKYWDLISTDYTMERNDRYDGHAAADVAQRLRQLIDGRWL